MPQDGSNNYQYPPGTPGIPDTTIESEAYNTFLDDLVINDLNIARPVHRGGTGANNANTALVNLTGEKATQLVTNYDSHVWMPGSFRSSNATGQAAPVDGRAFAGICYINEPFVSPPTNDNVTVEARDQGGAGTLGNRYIRQKIAGVWGDWVSEAQSVTNYVNTRIVDALAYSGIQVNGGMDVSQERGTTGTAVNGQWALDGWRMLFGGTMIIGSAQSATSIVPGFPCHLPVNCGQAQASIGASDLAGMVHVVEGHRIARLAWGTANAQPITIAFWSANNRTGLYSVTVRNSPSTHSYAFTYNQAVANVAQYNVVTVPGAVAGAWASDNSVGLVLTFTMAAGSSITAPSADTWLAGNYVAAPGQINAVAATSDIMRLTGLIVVPGAYAPTAAQSPLIMRPYDQELATCQRYYFNGSGDYHGLAVTPMIATSRYQFPVEMRVGPTVTGTFAANSGNAGTFAANVGSRFSCVIYNSIGNWTVNAIITFPTLYIDARL